MKFRNVNTRIAQRLVALDYKRRDGRPDIARFCRDRHWDPRTFYPWVNSPRNPGDTHLQKLAKDLEVSVSWLLHGDRGVQEREPPERTQRRIDALTARARAIIARVEQDLEELQRIRDTIRGTLGKGRVKVLA